MAAFLFLRTKVSTFRDHVNGGGQATTTLPQTLEPLGLNSAASPRPFAEGETPMRAHRSF
jgi:hypothetical protein